MFLEGEKRVGIYNRGRGRRYYQTLDTFDERRIERAKCFILFFGFGDGQWQVEIGVSLLSLVCTSQAESTPLNLLSTPFIMDAQYT